MFTIKVVGDDGAIKLTSALNVDIYNRGSSEFVEYEKIEGEIKECKAYVFELDFTETDEETGAVEVNQMIIIGNDDKCYVTDSGGNTVAVV